MPNRRILSLWFPRLAAERAMRLGAGPACGPLAIVGETGNMQVVASLNAAAQAAGVHRGQPMRDAHAMCAGLITRAQDPLAEAAFLTALRRWAGKFSPWVAQEVPDGLIVDLTGCAHLFGGEAALVEVVRTDCADLGLTVQAGVADTLGAAWALARFAGTEAGPDRNGDAIDQEARATRSRAGKRRHWTRGGAAPALAVTAPAGRRIAPPGQGYTALSPLPVAALRLPPDMVSQLGRLGLRRVGDLLGQPRAALARRFGRGLVLRLDQAMGSAPEPVAPARAPDHFAVRMSFPDPIGLEEDILAGLDRMLPRFCAQLAARGQGVRALRLEAWRSDQNRQVVRIGLARPARDADRIRPLLAMKLERIDPGFGIDTLRLVAEATEPLHDRQPVGHREAGDAVARRLAGHTVLDDLIGRLGARVGLEAITRLHPASSHIPEKTAKVLAAAWSDPAGDWPAPPLPRPLLLWRPEPVQAPDVPMLPAGFRWRGRVWELGQGTGPERIAPEWWLDDAAWRSGVRDYWVVTTACGDRLWLFYAHGAAMSSGWFCQGRFA
ncbi:MAG: DNA polymerase Y family protein [Rhodobacteraceae bacterium]|nr:DNA polymerase Y family protein [Paracoccaceae bacterium]